MKSTIGFVVFAALTALAGCSATTDAGQDEETQAAAGADAYTTGLGAKLGGAYQSRTAAYPRLDLDAAKQTYNWDTGIRCNFPPCPSGETGSWALYRGVQSNRSYVGLRSTAGKEHWFRVYTSVAGNVSLLEGAFGETQSFVPRKAPVVGCAAMLCGPDTICDEDATGQGVCKPYATCKTAKCAGGNFCADRPIQCFMEPCPPTAPSCEACPAPGTTINCTPIVPADRQPLCNARASIQANCPGVQFTF